MNMQMINEYQNENYISKTKQKAPQLTSSLPLCDRMCRRPSHDFPSHKTHRPSEYDARHFRLASRPDKIVAADIPHSCLQYLSSLSHLLPIFCFDKRNMHAPKENLANRQHCDRLVHCNQRHTLDSPVASDDLTAMGTEGA